jgi:hypothetical protein
MMRVALCHQAGFVPEPALHLVEIHVSPYEPVAKVCRMSWKRKSESPRGRGLFDGDQRSSHGGSSSLSRLENMIPRRQGKGNYADVRSCIQL